MIKIYAENGFQLIELLIVISIIGILAGIAIPNYQHYLTISHREQAKSLLMKLAIQVEEYGIAHNGYQDIEMSSLSAPLITNYEFKIIDHTRDRYSIIAIPVGVQAEHDIECGILKLDINAEIYCSSPANTPS